MSKKRAFAELEGKKRVLSSLVIAHSDIGDAIHAARIMVDRGVSTKDDLWHPLQTAIVVAYARPYSTNKGISRLPKRFRKFVEPERQRIHDRLIKMRNETIAHGDKKHRDVVVVPKGVSPHPDIDARGHTEFMVSFYALDPASLDPVIRHMVELRGKLYESAISLLEEELRRLGVDPDWVYSLDTGDPVEHTPVQPPSPFP